MNNNEITINSSWITEDNFEKLFVDIKIEEREVILDSIMISAKKDFLTVHELDEFHEFVDEKLLDMRESELYDLLDDEPLESFYNSCAKEFIKILKVCH